MTTNLTLFLTTFEDKVLDLIDGARAAEVMAASREDQVAIGHIAGHLTTILEITRNLINPGWNTIDGEKIEEFLGRFASRWKERVWPSWHKEVVDGRLAQTSIAVTGASQSM